MLSWRDVGGPARNVGRAVAGSVEAARRSDLAGFQSAAAELAALPAEQTGRVLGAVVRLLLEDQHKDGIDGDDLRQVLTRCHQSAAAWLPRPGVEVEPLVAVLSSALGIHQPGVTFAEVAGSSTMEASLGDAWRDPETAGSTPALGRAPTSAEYAWHAPLLIADLLTAAGRPLSGYLDRAFAEIAVAETMEMP